MIKHLLFYTISFVLLANCAIVPSEVMYNPRQITNGFEYIELYNSGSSSVDLSGWSFTAAINFTFPSGASIAPSDFVVVANSKNKVAKVYTIPDAKLFGPYGGKLSSKGETVTLVNAAKVTQFSFTFDNKWYPLTDGYGSSLELICADADPQSPSSWRASPVPFSNDPNLEYSGTPGAQSTWYQCPAPAVLSTATVGKPVYFSEVNYKPRQENTRVEFHEFIEFYNDYQTTLVLDNWRVVSKSGFGSVQYQFPVGSTVPAKSFFVLAKNKVMLNQVYGFASNVVIFGDYLGELRGSDDIALIDTNGQIVEEFGYGNDMPWPIAASGITGDQFKGMSLQRVTFTIASSKKYNWVAAVPTPGAINTGSKAVPDPVVTDIFISNDAVATATSINIKPDTSITVQAFVGPKRTSGANLVMQYFVDNIATTGETQSQATMTLDSANTQNNEHFKYTFSAGFPVNSVVKYRFVSNGGVISPRINDPVEWHQFFVSPQVETTTNSYHLFLTTQNWDQLWSNLKTNATGIYYTDMPESCCQINPNWNDDVPALLGFEGQAYDVKVNYQGSAYNRFRGTELDYTTYTGNGPSQPTPALVLSWKIELPKGFKINGKEDLYLLKHRDGGCSFTTTYLMYELAHELGLPSPLVEFARLNINGGFYSYSMDLHYYDSNVMESRYLEDSIKDCTSTASEEVGFMYKAGGYGCEGPEGPANEEYLWPIESCESTGLNYSTYERTKRTYDLETHKSWGGWDNIVNLTDMLQGPNTLDFSEANPVAQAWFRSNFDVNLMLNYITLVNWGGAWDELMGNHMIYQRITDGKWTMAPWDMDSYFGQTQPCEDPTCSIYLGEKGAPVGIYQTPGGHNVLKDRFIKTFRNELNERFILLSRNVLSVENVNKIVAKTEKIINRTEYSMSGIGSPYNPGCESGITSWHAQRHAYVTSSLSAVSVPVDTKLNICPDKPAITSVHTTILAAPGQPNKPSNPTTSAVANTVSLIWDSPNPNGSPITSYTLEKRTTGDYTVVYSGPNKSYSDSGLDSSTTYFYRLKATNAQGSSTYSDDAAFIPGKAGEIPVTTGSIGPNSGAGTGVDADSSVSTITLSFVTLFISFFLFL